ncbi:MAG: cytochrome c [Anaerolineae bacterium]|nr:cytochrome c [Anaerolineae bacterium]
MKNRKNTVQIAALLLTVLLAFAMTACGGGGDQAPASDSSSDDGGQAAGAPVGSLENGQTIYNGLCIACHGADATGVEGLGKDLTTSEFLADSTDEELIAFIIAGRPMTDPANTTGVDMPPRGGNPNLTDEEIADVVSFVRSLQK